MKVKVNLYGTLSQQVPGYQHSKGIEVELRDGATVKDLLVVLEISESRRAVVVMEGRILKPDDTVQAGAHVKVFQSIHGG